MDFSHRSSATSAADRLNAFRQPMETSSAKSRMFARKNEVLMGASVILVGLLLLVFVLLRPARTQSVIESPIVSSDVVGHPESQLLAGEALIALAVQPGNFPPHLMVGDTVKIAVTPGLDGNGDTRLIPDEVLVADILGSSDSQIESVITVRAPQSLLVNVAASGEIHVAKVNGVAK